MVVGEDPVPSSLATPPAEAANSLSLSHVYFSITGPLFPSHTSLATEHRVARQRHGVEGQRWGKAMDSSPLSILPWSLLYRPFLCRRGCRCSLLRTSPLSSINVHGGSTLFTSPWPRRRSTRG